MALKTNSLVTVVGAGLAGSECAYQLAQRGHRVVLYEMKPSVYSPAHKNPHFAELVCSNSFGSQSDHSAPGQLKWEAEKLNSLILRMAKQASVPAGQALGIDREVFSKLVTEVIESHPLIEVRKERVTSLDDLPRPLVIATGPLTDEALAQDLQRHFGNEFLYFFDAIAPIIDADSIDYEKVFRADRWDLGTGDYLNCPLNQKEYLFLINMIRESRKIEPKEFEKTPYFESCMPVEAILEHGDKTLRFGPMSPKGLRDPKTGKTPYAVVQLRQENREATAYNMVGFQTKMAYPEQTRVFRFIPGLENAEFLKLGSMHKNLYVNSTLQLNSNLSSRKDPGLFLAGQITGVEGYFESTCMGLLVARFLADSIEGKSFSSPPRATALGSLLHALTGEEKKHFQPTNINFGLFPSLAPEAKIKKDEKRQLLLREAKSKFLEWFGHSDMEAGKEIVTSHEGESSYAP